MKQAAITARRPGTRLAALAPPRLRLAAFGALFVLAAAAWPGQAASDLREATEADLKAAMVANFAKFIEWPAAAFADARSPLVIVVAGAAGAAADPFVPALEEAARDRAVGGHPLQVRRAETVGPRDAAHILYISRGETRRMPELLAAAAGRPLLTVSDLPGFLKAGGMIGFSVEDERLAFHVHRGAAQRAGLQVSSKLLKLAASIRESAEAPGGGGK